MSAPHFMWEWQEPLQAAACYARQDEPFVLLHSALPSAEARYSYLALDARLIVEGREWHELDALLATLPPDIRLFGYAGYEMGAEPLLDSTALPSTTHLPAQWWMLPGTLLRFDHRERRIEGWGTAPIRYLPPASVEAARCIALGSNFSAARYRSKVEAILEDIRAGDYYQANLTRKFHGRLHRAPHALALFTEFCAISPAPFAALIHTPDWQILSSSMEEFLTIEGDRVRACPIKGTIPRGATEVEDAALAAALASSAKDRAENTMIVDLMRHDLAQVCEPGSVKVTKLCALESYAQLHHLVSTIEGRLQSGQTPLDVLRACLPPGSMTGAPKRASVRRLAELETAARGPYSGMLGWIGPVDARMSVIIRTLILEDTRFEFQVGGGIVQDSDPEREWRETLLKARGLARLLSISLDSLETL